MNILGSRQVISGKLAQDVADRDAELERLHDRGDERAHPITRPSTIPTSSQAPLAAASRVRRCG